MSKITTDAELATEMRGLVTWILSYFEQPHAWPLLDCDRVAMIKAMHYQAKEIRNSEPFLRAEVLKAAEAVRALDATRKKTK